MRHSDQSSVVRLSRINRARSRATASPQASRRSGTSADHAFVTRLRLLTPLDRSDIEDLRRVCGHGMQFPAKTDVVREGEETDDIHVLLDGWACRYKSLPDGRRQITALLLPGEFCDLENLYLQENDHALATLTECQIAKIKRGELHALAARRPPVDEVLGWLTAVQCAMLTEHSTCLGRRTAREHLAHLLCELQLRLRLIGRAPGCTYRLPLTQDQIGDVLGLTPVHVNRILQELRGDGVIAQHGQQVIINDGDELVARASFSPAYLHLGGPDESAAVMVQDGQVQDGQTLQEPPALESSAKD